MSRRRKRGWKQTLVQQTVVHIELTRETSQLALNLSTGTLSLLALHDTVPRLMAQEHLTCKELSILHPLLESYPRYCPHATLLACLRKAGQGDPTEEEIDRSHSDLLRAQKGGRLERFLRPMCSVISRARLKVQAFGFGIVSVDDAGYLLVPLVVS